MTTTEIIVWWTLGLAGLAGSMLCSGIETGLYATSSVRVFVRARSPGARASDRTLASALEHPERALTTLLLFNNAFNYLGTLAVTALLATLGMSDGALVLVQAVVLTPVLLVFAESLPKELFRAHADRLLRVFAPALATMRLIGTGLGIVPAIVLISRLAGRALGADAAGTLATPRARSADLIKHGSHDMSETQAGLVDRALLVESTTVGREMVPISDAACLRASWSGARVAGYIARRPHAAYPVLDERGRLVGVARIIDLAAAPDARAGDLAREALRVAEGSSAWEALGALRRAGQPLAVVVRGSQPVGIVTLKDLSEPLIGDLRAW